MEAGMAVGAGGNGSVLAGSYSRFPLLMRAGAALAMAACLWPGPLAGQTWVRTYRSVEIDAINTVRCTPDGGFVLGGPVDSVSGDDLDAFVLKLGAAGQVEWLKSYGGAQEDTAIHVEPISDGGYVLAAATDSFGPEEMNAWILKLDAAGEIEWQRVFGGADYDQGGPVIETPAPNPGILVAGYTASFGNGGDVWLLKLDHSGEVLWERTYGGGGTETAFAMVLMPDGGVAVGAWTESFGAGGWDYWILRLDASGGILWQKTWGGEGAELLDSLASATDGGLLVGGRGDSFALSLDALVLRLDASGDILWQKRYGGARNEILHVTCQAPDGGFLLGGWTQSFGSGGYEAWAVKVDASGDPVWEKTHGLWSHEQTTLAVGTAGGGLALVGRTNSFGVDPEYLMMALDADGETDPACDMTATSNAQVVDLPGIIADTTVVSATSQLDSSDSSVSAVSLALESWDPCGPDCRPLECGTLTVEPNPACEGRRQDFRATYAAGKGSVLVFWDFDGDTVTDQVGDHVQATLPAGDYTVEARATDACDNPAPQSCTMQAPACVVANNSLPEVSAVWTGARPLRVVRRGEGLIVEPLTGAAAYNIYGDLLGSWYFPTQFTGSRCGLTAWIDNVDGTITLDYGAPRNAWFLVTASSVCREGTAGSDSTGRIRMNQGTWEFCGPLR